MSWLKNAMTRAAEVGAKNNLARSVKNYVAEGAKLLQDRMSVRGANDFRLAVKKIEAAAIFVRGAERVQVLGRWVEALKEIEKDSKSAFIEKDSKSVFQVGETDNEHASAPDEGVASPRKASSVVFYDPESGEGPMNFRHVFLYSQALENIAISMIIEAPSDEEISLLLALFEMTLMGGKEVHNAIISSIQDLAKAFSSYQQEVLMKREDLLHFTRTTITGLKWSADLPRIDAEILHLQHRLAEDKQENPEEVFCDGVKDLGKTQEKVQMFSRLQSLLQQKKTILRNGESDEAHSKKVDRLSVLRESLASSMIKSEKQIEENRNQRQEALTYRIARSQEVVNAEKDIMIEIERLEKRRSELEAELKNVNSSLAAANTRRINAQEEREQFDEASSQIVSHLKMKEDEMLKLYESQRVESVTINTWLNFLEDTWNLRSSQISQNDDKLVKELDELNKKFSDLATSSLTTYKRFLPDLLHQMKQNTETINNLLKKRSQVQPDSPELADLERDLKGAEEVYMAVESQAIIIFSVIDNMKAEFYTHEESISRNAEQGKAVEAFDSVDQIKHEFEAIQRPPLHATRKNQKESELSKEESSGKQQEVEQLNQVVKVTEQLSSPKAHNKEGQALDSLDPDAELAMLESEFGKTQEGAREGFSSQEVGAWEFDEFEQDLISDAGK